MILLSGIFIYRGEAEKGLFAYPLREKCSLEIATFCLSIPVEQRGNNAHIRDGESQLAVFLYRRNTVGFFTTGNILDVYRVFLLSLFSVLNFVRG